MDSYHQSHHFPRAPPPQPQPQPPSSTADPYHHHHHHQSSLRPPVPPQGQWFPNQFQYSASPAPPPPSQWGPPPPHSDHPPPPPGSYPPPPHPYPSQPMQHNQFPPPPPRFMFQHPPPHSQAPQSYSQEWNNQNCAPHQGWEHPAQGNEDDWAARARAWADAKNSMESQQTQFAPKGRLEEQNYYHDQYSQPIHSNHPDMSHQPLPPSTYEQFPASASASTVFHPPPAYHSEFTPVTVSSEQPSYLSDGRPTYSVSDGSYGGNTSSVLHHQGNFSSSPSVHQQEVPSSNYSVTGKEDTIDQNLQSFKSLPQQNPSVHDRHQYFQPHIPPPYAYGKEPGPVGSMTNPSDQPLEFAPRFSQDHGLRTHSGFARNDSARSARDNDSVVHMPSLNSWSSMAPGMVYPPITPVLASGTQLDPPVAEHPSVPGHTPLPFGRFAGSGITPPIPAAAAPFPGAAFPPTILSGDAYGMSNMSERPKKASVPNWLREEIKKAVITSSSAEYPKRDAMEDEGVDKSFTNGDQTDSKSIDSSRSTEEEDDEDVVQEARTAAINQEIKRLLTEVLLKVTDELFDEIATKVLDEDDLAVEAKLSVVTSNQNLSSSPLSVSTPKASAKVLTQVKVQEPDNDNTSEKSSSSSPGDLLGLGNYASDDEKNDDIDGEIQSSNLQGSKTKFNIEPSSTKINLSEIQDAVGNASTRGNVIEHSGNHVISDINEGSTNSVNEMSTSTGFKMLNDNGVHGEMGQKHSLKPSSQGKDDETKLGDGTASGTKDILGMASEQRGTNVNGEKGSRYLQDGETKIKPHNSGKLENMRGSLLKDHVKEEGEVNTRTSEKVDKNRGKQNPRPPRKEETDNHNVPKEKLKDQGVKSSEKGKDSDSRRRSMHHKSEEKREDKLLRASTKDGTDRKREYSKDEENRRRHKTASESSRHKISRDRNKDKAVDHSADSSDDSDDSKRKVNSRKRDKSPSPIRSKRRQVSRSPHSRHSQRRHSPLSSLETTRARRRSRSRSPARRRR